jgi:uncharacterized protein (TIGR00730 family)
MQRVCVFAGSSGGVDAKYLNAAKSLGAALARAGMGMIFGGGSVGLMGACADAALAGGAEVVGVLPRALAAREIAHRRLTELRIVRTLHDRKAVMAALCDGFIALPGGVGTLDELFEAVTWRQLGLHDKPIGLLDVEGYFAPLLRFLQDATSAGFVGKELLEALPVRESPEELLQVLWPRPSSAEVDGR